MQLLFVLSAKMAHKRRGCKHKAKIRIGTTDLE